MTTKRKKKLNIDQQEVQSFVVEYENQSLSTHQKNIIGGYMAMNKKK